MWTCPLCKRPFKYEHQAHSCVQVNPDDLLSRKSELVKTIYNKIIIAVQKFGPFTISAALKDIYLKQNGTFIGIHPKKDGIDMEFYLQESMDEFPVYKTLRTSKNRVVHYVQLDDPGQVDKQLIDWMHKSYKLITAT
jgi:hypothetical protein